MRAFITGGAGCIGSELAQALADRGDRVIVYDNLSSGRIEHLEELLRSDRIEFVEGDMLDRDLLHVSLAGAEMVWHLAANSDVKFRAGDSTRKDLEQNVIATYNLLESMRLHGIKKLAFTSTSAVYGISERLPIAEEQCPRPISLYGASKAACEALIRAFAHLFDLRCSILRLANVVGPKVRKTGRTVISDFMERLRLDPSHLEVLGNGKQEKSYLYITDCIEAMLFVAGHAPEQIATYNIGGSDSITVTRIAHMVLQAMDLPHAKVTFTGTEGGWAGDVPRFRLDVTALNRLGWRARYNSEEAIELAIRHCAIGEALLCRQ